MVILMKSMYFSMKEKQCLFAYYMGFTFALFVCLFSFVRSWFLRPNQFQTYSIEGDGFDLLIPLQWFSERQDCKCASIVHLEIRYVPVSYDFIWSLPLLEPVKLCSPTEDSYDMFLTYFLWGKREGMVQNTHNE